MNHSLISKAAEKMRRYRERKKVGGVILQVELDGDDLVKLERLGFLPPGRRDKDALEKAALSVWKAGLAARRR